MNIHEEQNRAKLITLRKRHLIVKQRFYKSFGIQYRLHLHFYLLWKDQIAWALKTWRSWINVCDASFFFSHAIEREATRQLWANQNSSWNVLHYLWRGVLGYIILETAKLKKKSSKTAKKFGQNRKPYLLSKYNLDPRALLFRAWLKERRALGNPGTGVFLIGFREEQRTRTWLVHSNEKFA